MSSLSFTIVGGGAEIGANSYLLAANGHSILLDCGVHPKKEGREALPELSLLRKAPQAVVVSHGHIDHCGAVPYLLKSFPSTGCFATRPTVQVMDRMLHNSVSVMDTLAHERGVVGYPLFTHEDVEYTVRRSYGVNLDHDFSVRTGSPFRIRFHHAGHVLGSACVLLRTPDHNLFYTGDVCLSDQELMQGCSPMDSDVQVDTLITECTRGANTEANQVTYEAEVRRFAIEASKVLRNGGTVLVPSFALGRTQELLNVVARLQESADLPDVPVYASGLGRAIYEIYDGNLDYLHPNATLRPLYAFGRLGDVWEPAVTRKLLKKPSIVIATSGMMIENTPSALIADEIVRDNRHAIFFVGYVDPDTLGYKVLHAETGDRLSFCRGSPPRKIELENRQGFDFSAHASREELCFLIERLRPRNVLFVHGDPDAIQWMCQNTNPNCQKFTPSLGETVYLDL